MLPLRDSLALRINSTEKASRRSHGSFALFHSGLDFRPLELTAQPPPVYFLFDLTLTRNFSFKRHFSERNRTVMSSISRNVGKKAGSIRLLSWFSTPPLTIIFRKHASSGNRDPSRSLEIHTTSRSFGYSLILRSNWIIPDASRAFDPRRGLSVGHFVTQLSGYHASLP